jgi:hypothetical protein
VKQPISITVHGRAHTWAFTFKGDPKHIPDWQADGLEVAEVCNTIPLWVQQMGLVRPWCAAQDLWRFLRFW